MKIELPFAAAAILAASALPARADWGHVGELAGHGHWIGVAAAGAAAVIAIGLSVFGKKKGAESTGEEPAVNEGGTAETDRGAKA